MVTAEGSRPVSAEQRLKELGIKLPAPPEPFGAYTEAVQSGNLLFLSGMLPTEGHVAKFIGRVGAELDAKFFQPLLGAGRPRAFAGYHLPACAPPSTCNTSPVVNVASVRNKTASTTS